MAKKTMGQFDDIIEAAAKFVDQQKGVWDHSAWSDFLSGIGKMGFDVDGDMKAHMGSLLESLKKYYGAASATDGIANTMKGIAESTASFVTKTKGTWDHSEWEQYLKDMQKKGAELSDETVKYLGSILEISKELYFLPTFASKMMSKASAKKA